MIPVSAIVRCRLHELTNNNNMILDFIKPDKVIMLESTPTKGTFEFRPLEPGYGITIGTLSVVYCTLLLRVMLSAQSALVASTMSSPLSRGLSMT